MKAYSPDLRERVIAAVRDSDLSQAEIAKSFCVSLSTVENWWRSWRASERTEPLPHAGGVKRRLQPYAALIQKALKQQPDATLDELCASVETSTAVHANPSMMCRELQILNLPRKKVTARQSTRYTTRAKIAQSLSEKGASAAAGHRHTTEIHR
ncbi:MAG: helix-turn-helix domain-containing protein [Chloroflexi bacterium]|nr:helix-turn-helix domain-containing protein [Chloroflexota bacterium]